MTTPVLDINELVQQQSQPHVVVNEALRRIEALLVRVLSRSNGGPPSSPAQGDAYIVDSATGDWSAFAVDDIAWYQGGAWSNYTPTEGVRVWVSDEDTTVVWDGSAWTATGGGVTPEDDGTEVIPNASAINFGTGLSVADDGDGSVTVDNTVTRPDVEDDGTVVVAGPNAINFGSNLSVTDNGDGSATVDSAGGTGSITWEQVSVALTASANTRYLADTSGGAFTITLPASPSVGDTVYFADSARSWDANHLTVDGNGNNVVGSATLELDISEWSFSLVWNGTQWVFGDTSGNLFQAPEDATDSGTDAFVSAITTATPTAGIVIARTFQSANTTTTPTLDSVSIVARDGSSLWAGALDGAHRLFYDGTNYVILDPYVEIRAAKIATGEFTGDANSSQSITGLGFTPQFVEIYRRETSNDAGTQVFRTTPEINDDIAGGAAHRIASSTNAIQSTIQADAILSLDSDGFTVGSKVNTDGQGYNYWAMG